MSRARPATACGTERHFIEPIGRPVEVADLRVRLAGELSRLAAQHERMLMTVTPPVFRALVCVLRADGAPARAASRHLVRGENDARLERALMLMLRADEAPRTIGASHVLGAMHTTVDGTGRLMCFADILVAARAARDFITPDRFVASRALTGAVGAQSASVARRAALCGFGVRVAYRASAERACLDAGRAGAVIALLAERLVGGAMALTARAADARMFAAGRGLVHSAERDLLVPGEDVAANATGQSTCVARDLPRLREGDARRILGAASRTGDRPRPGAIQPAFTNELSTLRLVAGCDLPFRLLDEQLPFS